MTAAPASREPAVPTPAMYARVARTLVIYFIAIIWGFTKITSGLTMGVGRALPSIVGIGAMAAFMFWAGRRAFAKARASGQ